MAKTQVNLRMDEATAEPARHAAATRHEPVNEYVARLIRDDNEGLRDAFLAGADEVLDNEDFTQAIGAIEDAA